MRILVLWLPLGLQTQVSTNVHQINLATGALSPASDEPAPDRQSFRSQERKSLLTNMDFIMDFYK